MVALLALFVFAPPWEDRLSPSTSRKPDVSVFLLDSITPDQQNAIQTTLVGMVGAANVQYRSKADACAVFKKEFANQPTLVENVDCNALPASFEVVSGSTSPADIDSRVQGMPGVQKVVVPMFYGGS
jgi:cell division protein FtsX